jgi:hypothetical protein
MEDDEFAVPGEGGGAGLAVVRILGQRAQDHVQQATHGLRRRRCSPGGFPGNAPVFDVR